MLHAFRQKFAVFEHPQFQRIIIGLILLNAALLGMETSPAILAAHGAWMVPLDNALLAIFVVELAGRFVYRGVSFFKDPWAVFDLIVIAIALIPASHSFSVLRALRILRVLRLISMVGKLRVVVQGLLGAVPGLMSSGAILVIIFYVFAVMATKLFAVADPAHFGSLPTSLFTLFQIMTLEGWADIVRNLMTVIPLAWVFFIAWILASTFTMLNLFIGIIVNAMQTAHDAEEEETRRQQTATHEGLASQMARLEAEIRLLRTAVESRAAEPRR